MSDGTSWIARKPCGCVVAAVAYDPRHAKFTMQKLEEWQRAGLAVEMVTDDWVREHWLTQCPHEAQQLPLL